jgi:signal transduction histidine kinase
LPDPAPAAPDPPRPERAVRRTLRGSVSLLGLTVITSWVVLLTVVFNLVLANRLTSQSKTVLRARATIAAATVTVTGSGGIKGVHDSANDAALDTGIWIYSLTGIVERPRGGSQLQEVADSMRTGPNRYVSTRSDRLYSLALIHDGKRVGTVVASLSLDPYRHAVSIALLGSMLVAAMVLLGAYPVLRLAAGRALRPVDAMARQAADWSANAVTERFGDQHRYREIQTLAGSLDGVLDRLAAVVRHERQLSAELSHELRTPLARVIAETDLLLARPHTEAELETAHRSIRESAMATVRILETLMAAAREDMRDAPGRCELRPVVERVKAEMWPAEVNGVALSVDVGRLFVGVDAASLERVLSPILDNAHRYAVESVQIRARRTMDAVQIDVVDDGPGVAPEVREAIFEPGFRAEHDDGHEGVGLGLALARRLARAADGDVSVVGSGTTFRIQLPPG